MRRRLAVLIGILLVALLPACLDDVFGSYKTKSSRRKRQARLLSGGHRPLLVIGADGLDLLVVEKLAAEGHLRNIVHLMKVGCHGTLLSEREMRSPPLWTTIATGRPRSAHGIYDFVTGSRLWPKKLRRGKRRLVTSKMRRVPAIWNIASEEELKVAVLGWLNTWPAEQVNGVMVAPYVALGSAKQITIKGGVYRNVGKQVYPPERWEEFLPLVVETEDIPQGLVDDFAKNPSEAIAKDLPILVRYMGGLRWSLAHTLTMRNITLHLLKKDSPDLTMVYFEGSDSLAHRFWLFRQPHIEVAAQLFEAGYTTDHADELVELYGKVVDRYYIFLDAIIGELIQAMPPGGRVMIMSDHGFGNRSGVFPLGKSVPFTGEHRIEGTLIIAGPGIRSGQRIVGATHYNMMPTILELLGLDPIIDLEGNSLLLQIEDREDYEELAFEEGLVLKLEEQDEDATPFDEEEIERLRSLGYVE